MHQNAVCVGIDVDNVQCHGSVLDRQRGEVMSFQCRPTLKDRYEASYVGFSLQRVLQDRDYPREVVSPSSIPRRAGKAMETHHCFLQFRAGWNERLRLARAA